MNTNFGINVMTRNITDIIISLLKNKKYKNINIKKNNKLKVLYFLSV